jgi:hypothetical protein
MRSIQKSQWSSGKEGMNGALDSLSLAICREKAEKSKDRQRQGNIFYFSVALTTWKTS